MKDELILIIENELQNYKYELPEDEYSNFAFELAENIIKIIIKTNKLDEIIQMICTMEDINIELFLSNKRYRYLSEARAAYCILAKEKTDYSLLKIGKKINRDHTTVIHHLQNSSNYKSVKDIVKDIVKRIK